MKNLIGSALARAPRAQELALKVATYPRFLEWAQKNEGRDQVSGGPREKRNKLFELVADMEELRSQPISYFEFGVHKGESLRWWSTANDVDASRFYGFDSFEGLPEHWLGDRSAGFFSTGGQVPQSDDGRVEFVKGWFHQTLPSKLPLLETANRRVIHMDADLYRSTIYVLLLIAAHLKAGDIMIFDEFADSAHEFRAFEDFRSICGVDAQLIGATRGFNQSAFRIA